MENKSFWFDLKIIIKTVPKVITSENMTNENIDEIALHLNKTGVNVEIQSINKKQKT